MSMSAVGGGAGEGEEEQAVVRVPRLVRERTSVSRHSRLEKEVVVVEAAVVVSNAVKEAGLEIKVHLKLNTCLGFRRVQ